VSDEQDRVVTALSGWVTQAVELRYAAAGDPEGPVRLPPTEAGLDVVLASLLRVRKRLDRVEELLTNVIQARGKLRQRVEAAESEYQQIWNESLTSDPRLQSREFVAPKEKYAHADLSSMKAKRLVLQMRALAAEADSAFEVIRTAHKGLDSLRYDHVVLIRAATVMSSLEG